MLLAVVPQVKNLYHDLNQAIAVYYAGDGYRGRFFDKFWWLVIIVLVLRLFTSVVNISKPKTALN